MALGVAVILKSSLALRGLRRRPAAPVDGVAVAVESTVLRASPGGAPRVLLTVVLHWSRSVHHPRVAPMLAEGPAEEKVQGFGSTVVGAVPVMSAQCTASPHSAGIAPGMVAQ